MVHQSIEFTQAFAEHDFFNAAIVDHFADSFSAHFPEESISGERRFPIADPTEKEIHSIPFKSCE